MCFWGIFLQTVRAHPVTNLPLHINRRCISRQAAVNSVFFLRSCVLWTLSRPSRGEEEFTGVAASPWPPSFTLSSTPSSAVSGDYWIYLIRFSVRRIFVFLIWLPPPTNTWMRWKLDIISRHWLRRNFLLAGINRNVITRPLKHSTSAEINTAELRGLKHWIVKVD